MPKKSIDDKAESVISQSIQESKKTYGGPARGLFNCIMKTEDETHFYHLIEMFRSSLKQWGQGKLLDYFERQFFAPHRIPKWAAWFRKTMFNCKWLLNTNMHVESWHNILKTHVMGRLKNVRIDKFLLILVKCEVLYFWKWSRARLGCYLKCDPGWAVMHGHLAAASVDPPNLLPTVEMEQILSPTAMESKRTSYKEAIYGKVDTVKSLLKTRELPLDRQKVTRVYI